MKATSKGAIGQSPELLPVVGYRRRISDHGGADRDNKPDHWLVFSVDRLRIGRFRRNGGFKYLCSASQSVTITRNASERV